MKPPLDERVSYLRLDDADLARLAVLRPLVEEHADAFVEAFYRHLLSFQPTREMLRDPDVKARLLVKQRQYLLSLGGPTLDDAYVAERRRIGDVHEGVGLEPRWYLGAYALYLSLLQPLVLEASSHDPMRGATTLTALQKLLFLDAQLAMEA